MGKSLLFLLEALKSNTVEVVWALLIGGGITALVRALPRIRPDFRVAYGIVFPAGAVLAIATWNGIFPALAFHAPHPEVGRMIRSHHWIAYEPRDVTFQGVYHIDGRRVREELTAIRRAHFTGIVTYSMQGDLARIPAIASSVGLVVIAGIWDPTDRRELRNAIDAQKYVAGYCVGHWGLYEGRYSFDQLRDAMQIVRFRTARPVSTTEKLDEYEVNAPLREIGDWLFPDAYFVGRDDAGRYRADVPRDVNYVLEGARLIVHWDQSDPRAREILLKTIGYPYAGIDGASQARQAEFFALLLDPRRDSRSAFPPRVEISVWRAFPNDHHPTYYPWDLYTSLFDEHARPRPAVGEIMRRLR